MNARIVFPGILLAGWLAAVSVFAQQRPAASDVHPSLRTKIPADATVAARVLQAQATLSRARSAAEAEDFATAQKEYRSALELSRGVTGAEKIAAEALKGFSESGVKLARQRKALGKKDEASQIVREILSTQFDPKYRPALELQAELQSKTKADFLQPATSPAMKNRSPAEIFRATPPPTLARQPPSPMPTAQASEPTFRESSTPPAIAKPAKKPLVNVYFATDRLPSGGAGPSKYFGVDWNKSDEPLVTGFVTVSIPPGHKEGHVERPTDLFLWEEKEDAKKHFVLTKVQVAQGDEFYSELRKEFDDRSEDDRSAFVYVHGFNVSFDEAAYDTAQLAYDLDFPGVPMMFSWPSQGEVLAYDGDEETVEFSFPHLQTFLERVARESGAKRIHVMAHSMGNRLLTKALTEVVREPDIQPIFDNIIMASPDVNATVFTQLWPKIKVAAKRFTLYASSDDNALILSRKAKGGSNFIRLGEGGPNITVIPGLDTIDASGIDTSHLGHSYEMSCKPVMDDLGQIIRQGLAPGDRKLHNDLRGLGYWLFP